MRKSCGKMSLSRREGVAHVGRVGCGTDRMFCLRWREGETHTGRMACGTDRMFCDENDPCSGSQAQSPFWLPFMKAPYWFL